VEPNSLGDAKKWSPLKEWLAGWADHPGTAWVLGVYRNQRPPSAAV
jgi:hypothetical protein